MIALGSCSTDPSAQIARPTATAPEQTVEATASPSIPSDEQWPAADEKGTVPDGMEFAANAEGYEFSDEPQGAGERWIYDNYPELWEQGVRAVSSENILLSYDAMTYEPGPTVQYIGGERYEGTPQMPLGFRGQTDNPDSFAIDVIDNMKEMLRDPSKSIVEVGNIGNGGYEIYIAFNPNYERLPDSQDTFVYIQEQGRGGVSDSSTPRVFADYEEALQWVLNNPLVPNIEGDGVRELNRGEIASISVSREKMDGTRSNREFGVYNPSTGQIDWVS